MTGLTPVDLHESPRPRLVHTFPRCPVLLSILTLTQFYVTVHMHHVRSQHMCPKAGVNSLVLIPIRHTKYGGGKSLVRVQALPLTASTTHSYPNSRPRRSYSANSVVLSHRLVETSSPRRARLDRSIVTCMRAQHKGPLWTSFPQR